MEILQSVVQNIQDQNDKAITKFRDLRSRPSIFLSFNPINRNAVDLVHNFINSAPFIELRKKYTGDNIDIIVDSYGGDADAAYHIAKILDKNFSGEITYIIPRSAKSAATLLVCGGDKIIMGETSELGPLDPQIRQENGSFISAKSVKATLDLIKENLKDDIELAAVLTNKINPLTLGEYDSAIKIAEEYQKELLGLRMFRKSKGKVNAIVKKFSTGFTHHSRVIDAQEAFDIFGKDNIETWDENQEVWKLLWQFYLNNNTIYDLVGLIKKVDGTSSQ